MLLQLLLSFTVVLKCTVTTASEVSKEKIAQPKKDNAVGLNHLITLIKSNSSPTYFEEGENMLRVPVFKEHHQKKSPKKTPKRTIQKIIKKKKQKVRKAYMNQITSVPTKAPENVDIYDNPQDEMGIMSQRNEATSTQPTQNKKPRKWSSKRARYPVPFHKLQGRKEMNTHRKNKRETNRSDVYILQDLDEIEFLHNQDGNDIVEAHVKKYW